MRTRCVGAAAGSTIAIRRISLNAITLVVATTLLAGTAVASGKSKLIPLTAPREHVKARQEPVARTPVTGTPFTRASVSRPPVAQPLVSRKKEAPAAKEQVGEPSDPLQLVVSLKDQRLDVYRGTQIIESTRVSSGKTGYGTPTGVFSILEKRKVHYSNLYDDAPMPFMQRITWSGVALHEGRVPNYPASHGCIRLPRGFAQKLFGMTERGAHVLVVRDEAQPEPIVHEVLLQPFVEEATVASLDQRTIDSDPALRGAIDSDAIDENVLPKKASPKYSSRPLRILITRASEQDQIRDLQRVLLKLGYDAGPVDGVYGRKTRMALETYQEGADLPVTGIASTTVLKRLYAEAGRAGPGNGRVLSAAEFPRNLLRTGDAFLTRCTVRHAYLYRARLQGGRPRCPLDGGGCRRLEGNVSGCRARPYRMAEDRSRVSGKAIDARLLDHRNGPELPPAFRTWHGFRRPDPLISRGFRRDTLRRQPLSRPVGEGAVIDCRSVSPLQAHPMDWYDLTRLLWRRPGSHRRRHGP